MMSLQGKGVVITGAASGIGEALALAAGKRGAKLLLADINADRLHALRTTLRAQNVEVSVMRTDVAVREDIDDLAKRAQELWGGADVLINNAGVSVMAPALAMKESDARWLMDINFWGVWNGCRAFGPQLQTRPAGVLVNMSSLFAWVSMPTQSIYNASKAAVRAYSDALREELAGTPVRVLTVFPGGVKTAIARSARTGDISLLAASKDEMVRAFETNALTTPDVAAERILRAVEDGRTTRLPIGKDATWADWLARLMPQTATARLVRRVKARRGR